MLGGQALVAIDCSNIFCTLRHFMSDCKHCCGHAAGPRRGDCFCTIIMLGAKAPREAPIAP